MKNKWTLVTCSFIFMFILIIYLCYNTHNKNIINQFQRPINSIETLANNVKYINNYHHNSIIAFVNCRPVYLKDFLIQKVTSNYNCQKSKQNVKNKISALSNSQYSKLMGENQLETDQDIFQSLVDQTVLNQLYKKYHVSVSVNDAKKVVSQQDLQIQKSLKSSNKDERESAKGTYDQIQDFIKAYKMNGNDYKNARVESAKRILMFDQLYDKYSKQFATESDFEKQQNFQVFIRLKEKHACVIKLF